MSDTWQTALALESGDRARGDAALGLLLLGLPGSDSSLISSASAAWRTRVIGDPNPRFQVDADGKHWWGSGAGAFDVDLYRNSATVLRSSSYLVSDRDVYGRFPTGTQVRIGNAGPGGQSGVEFQGGEAGSNLYRYSAGRLAIDGALGVVGKVSGAFGAAAETGMGAVGPASEAGVLFGTAADTNLYRASAAVLKTDGALGAVGVTIGGLSLATRTDIGATGPAGQSGISFQNGEAGSNLYRVSAGAIKTDGVLAVGTDLYVRHAGAAQVTLGAMGPSSEAGMVFGSANDTNLYRQGVNTLKTDDLLVSALDVFVRHGSGTQVGIGNVGPAGQSGISFQLGDTSLYRQVANQLATGGNFDVTGFMAAHDVVVAKYTAASEMRMGAQGPSGEAGLTFGVAADTNLYRSAANTLKTDDAFIAALGLQIPSGMYLTMGGAVIGAGAIHLDIAGAPTDIRFLNNAYTQPNLIIADGGGVTIPRGALGLADGSDIGTGVTTGTKIASGTTQKIGFWGATPIVRPSAFTQTYATASKTHANLTASNPPAGGTGTAAGGYNTAANRDLMIASLTNAIADIVNLKQVVNAIIDDLQLEGLLA